MHVLPALRSCVEGTVVCNDTGGGDWAPIDLIIGLVVGVVAAVAVVVALLVLALRSTRRTAERFERATDDARRD